MQKVYSVLMPVYSGIHLQNRSMSTLKTLKNRLQSVKNIRQITKSMKMVAAVKFARAEREAKNARVIGKALLNFLLKVKEITYPAEKPPLKVIFAVTSDRGLCGSVHVSVVKQTMALIKTAPEQYKVFCIGDKSRNIVQRYYPKNIIFAGKDVGRASAVFGDAAKIASALLSSKYAVDFGCIVYNKFISMISFKTSIIPVYSVEAIDAAPKLEPYDLTMDATISQCYAEFMMAALIFYAMKESIHSEQASRMTAMDNASRNAGEMMQKIAIKYNRTRQAVITRELIEIIGASESLK